jgi:hypothetical protein
MDTNGSASSGTLAGFKKFGRDTVIVNGTNGSHVTYEDMEEFGGNCTDLDACASAYLVKGFTVVSSDWSGNFEFPMSYFKGDYHGIKTEDVTMTHVGHAKIYAIKPSSAMVADMGATLDPGKNWADAKVILLRYVFDIQGVGGGVPSESGKWWSYDANIVSCVVDENGKVLTHAEADKLAKEAQAEAAKGAEVEEGNSTTVEAKRAVQNANLATPTNGKVASAALILAAVGLLMN